MIGFAHFYRHFWNSKYKKTAEKDLYDDFNKTIRGVEDAENFLKELKKESKQYLKIVYPERSDYDNKKEYYWLVQSLKILNEYFNIVQVRIVLLSLFDAKERDIISTVYFKKTILFLENFHFVYTALTSGKSNRFDSIFTTYAIKLRKANDKAEGHELLEKFMSKLKSILPKYDVFEKAFVKLTYSKSKAADNIKTKYVLNKINW